MPAPTPNPYRQILARKFPDPLIALLAFILGVWLWDHYFGKEAGYSPGTEAMALVKFDRDIRLAESMAQDPAWLKWLVGADSPEAVCQQGLKAFAALQEEKALTEAGSEPLVVIVAQERSLSLLDTMRQVSGGQDNLDLPKPYETIVDRLVTGQGHWWDRELLRAYEKDRGPGPDHDEAIRIFEEGNKVLRARAILSRGALWAVVGLGTLLLPWALIRLIRRPQPRFGGYSTRWSAPCGLVVFLVAVLAWIGFDMTLRTGLNAVLSMPPWLSILLDSCLRLLPAAIAIGLLFRRPSHVARVLGLIRWPDWIVVLGLFAGLTWINQVTSWLFAAMSPIDPSGGLGLGERGGWGLAFAIVSACLVAPFAEEVIYRGVLFRSLANRFGLIAAAILSSGAFAVVHFYNLAGLVGVAIFGFVCAIVFGRTRELATVIALHALYNLAVKLPEWCVYHSSLY